MALRPEHVGQRVVVRSVLTGQAGPSGGPAMTDVLGVLDAFTDTSLVVRRDDGRVVTVERDRVVAAKPVPPRGSRSRISAAALESVCAAGWQGTVQRRLGDWILRAAEGFTGRANSALVAGDPGVPVDEALTRVDDFYREAGLPVQAQAVVGSAELDLLDARGWTPSRPFEADVLVQTASLGRMPVPQATRGAADIRLRERPTPDWLRRYGRSAARADDDVVLAVLTSGELVTFASLGEPAVAIGRAVVTGDWLGLSAVEVDPSLQGRGLGSSVVAALLGWGATRGARSAYIQALSDNAAARALYARFGFSTHHTYRYLRPED
jgi:GNAT superfamily N-acetyltransferase